MVLLLTAITQWVEGDRDTNQKGANFESIPTRYQHSAKLSLIRYHIYILLKVIRTNFKDVVNYLFIYSQYVMHIFD